MKALIAVCALAGAARADVAWGLQVAGGIDGGPIAGPRAPGAVAETGMLYEAIDGQSGSGIGASVDVVHRANAPFGRADEVKVDMMYRWASADRKVHLGLGFGLRAAEQLGGATIHGFDMLHVDVSGRVARSKHSFLELYSSETVGCYHDTYAMDGDAPAVTVDCLDTLSIAVVVGVRATLASR